MPVLNLTCCDCGCTFAYSHSRGKPKSRCPACAKKRVSANDKAYRKRKFKSTVTCQICGKEVTKTNGNQQYCPDCARDLRLKRMAEWRKQQKAIYLEYVNSHHDKMLSLYNQGFNDCVIAREVGLPQPKVWQWRTDLGLPAHKRTKKVDPDLLSLCWTCAKCSAVKCSMHSMMHKIPDGAEFERVRSFDTGLLTIITQCPKYVEADEREDVEDAATVDAWRELI